MNRCFKKVLFIAYIYPPLGGSGVQRSLKFTRFLYDLGWKSYVVCGDDSISIGNGIDTTLMAEIPKELYIWRRSHINPMGLRQLLYRVLRLTPRNSPEQKYYNLPTSNQLPSQDINTSSPSRRVLQRLGSFFSPIEIPPIDSALYWSLSILGGCLRIIHDEKIDLIYSSSFPYSDHVTAWFLKQLTGLPWVADFRDPWTQNPFHKNIGWRFWIDSKVERKILNYADAVICITPTYTEGLSSLADNHMREKFTTIENGYDPEDFKYSEISERYDNYNISYIDLAHIGLLYGGSAIPLLEALQTLGNEAKRIRCRFVGGIAKQETDWIQHHTLDAIVEITTRVSHKTAVKAMQTTDLLLLLINDGPEWVGHYPGKLFEYMASGKPIMLIGPIGESAKLIINSGTGCCFEPSDTQGIVHAISLLLEDPILFHQTYYHPQSQIIRSYERRLLTARLKNIFDELVEEKN